MIWRVITTALILAWLGGVALFEWAAWDWHPAREVPAGTSPWHWLRAAVTAVLSTLLVAAFARDRSSICGGLSPCTFAAALCVLATTITITALLAFDPLTYHAIVEEDGVVEWGSALLLLVASGYAFAWFAAARRGPKREPLDLLASGAFAALFFVMAMEEISWFQRVIGFETPEAVGQRNWQGEFNLHNFHTDITELALYAGTGIFLVLLPLLRESLANVRPFDRVVYLLPDRAVAAVSAPMLMLTYGQFDLLPVQATTWIGTAVMLVFARDASAGGQRAEALLYIALAIGVVLGQAAYLALGHTMIEIFDATEYREAIIAGGLALYAYRQWGAARGIKSAVDH